MITAEVGVARVEERELLRTLRWWDGFVIALANPGFLIASLGFTIGTLGPWGAVLVWTASMVIGTLQAWIYQEPAAMFPDKPGGIALYAHEGWKKYFTPAGPLATFGYWFGWSSVLSIFGLLIGNLITAQWFTGSTWSIDLGVSTFGLPEVIAITAIVGVAWFNLRGIRPTVWLSYVTGALLFIPLLLIMLGTFASGDFKASNLKSSFPGWTLIFVWLYAMAWSSYATESVATFAPEYKRPDDTSRALRSSSLFDIVVFFLLPLGVVGTLSVDQVNGPTGGDAAGTYVVTTMRQILGGGAAGFFLLFVVAGLLLSMNTATMDASRALYGISREGLTLKWFGRLNDQHMPANAIIADAAVNVALLVLFDNTLAILVASNLGYVLAHILALTGVLLLRRDRPDAVRPVKLASYWLPVAAILAALNVVFLVVGNLNLSKIGYAGTDKLAGISVEFWYGLLILLMSLVLWGYRRKVEDTRPEPVRQH